MSQSGIDIEFGQESANAFFGLDPSARRGAFPSSSLAVAFSLRRQPSRITAS